MLGNMAPAPALGVIVTKAVDVRGLSHKMEIHQELSSVLCSLRTMLVVVLNYRTGVQLTLEQHGLELRGPPVHGCFLVTAGRCRKCPFPPCFSDSNLLDVAHAVVRVR